jgi:hypothetical protein
VHEKRQENRRSPRRHLTTQQSCTNCTIRTKTSRFFKPQLPGVPEIGFKPQSAPPCAHLRIMHKHAPGQFVFPTAGSAYFRDPCTVMHKRKIPAGARYPRNQNKSLLLRGNWLRSAKRPATRPPVGIREIREIHRATRAQPRPQAGQGVRFFRGARPIRVYSPPFAAPCFPRSAHSHAQTQSRRHLPLPDSSNNIQPLIENWLRFAKAPAASPHCAGAPVGQPALK